jgi:catalase
MIEDDGNKTNSPKAGEPMETKEAKEVLTNRQGHPIYDNQSSRTVGNRGPVTLENYPFLEKITHFDRERIPERVVHARGAGAHGYFEAYGTVGDEPIAKFTRAKLFQEKGKKTPVFVRFSTVIHGGTSPETCATRAVSPLNFILTTATGMWSETICRYFLSATPSNFPMLFTRSTRPSNKYSRPAAHYGFYELNARIDAYADVAVQPARNYARLPAYGRLRRQYLQMV